MGGISPSLLHRSLFQTPSPSQKAPLLSQESTQSTTKRPFGGQFLKVADVCKHLAAWKGDIIGGVDGHQLLERYLVTGNSKMADALSPQ
ncbi:hypothetical protein BDV24DRAFT_159943 [Aspergillus arachidicola]|uniref:Uncharacterized protein n=1 Tax=Aspergillus arachidicola TaxID=656916 RepID=A0A2G7FNV9_9EURO|nr:hypothetical protein BDV24DRAFT_159943 [Aspergillus arachidicola]PIG82284.1 hypothetical protein AARAC_000063 [Aspergillus arachidicola]